jgi:hypothetical protein
MHSNQENDRVAPKTVFVVQAFEMHRKRLVPTTKEEARNEERARQMAERVAARKAGAAILALTIEAETGEMTSGRVLARYGEVPDDLEQLLES